MNLTKLCQIRTPTHLRPVFGSHDCTVNWLLPPDPEIERAVRHAVDAITIDLQYISNHDSDLISLHLDSVEEPLSTLSTLGFTLSFALGTRRAKWGEVVIDDWQTTYFVVSESPLIFAAVEDSTPSKLHILNGCGATTEQIVLQKGDGVLVLGRALIQPEWFDHETEWCSDCWQKMSLTREALKEHYFHSGEAGSGATEKPTGVTDEVRQSELASIELRFGDLDSDVSITPKKRGYELESLIGRLCKVWDIGYDPPKSQPGQQLDGAIRFEGKVLVVEARWRKNSANFADITKLSGKARARLVGTIGLFVSMEGFTSEGVDLWLQSGHQRDCILLPGCELRKVIRNELSWPEALHRMIHAASVLGDVLVRL